MTPTKQKRLPPRHERDAVLTSRMETPHVKGCHALAAVERGDWSSPWACLAETPYSWRDKRGSNKRWGRNIWLRFRCNDTNCPATIVVRADDITDALPHA